MRPATSSGSESPIGEVMFAKSSAGPRPRGSRSPWSSACACRRARRVHPDAPRSVLDRERPGEVHDAALRRAVGRRVRLAHEAGVRRDVHDGAPAVEQVREHRRHMRNVPVRLTPMIRCQFSAVSSLRAHEAADPGGVDEHLRAAEIGGDRRDRGFDAVEVGDVARVRARGAAVALDLRGGLRGGLLVDVQRRDECLLVGQSTRDARVPRPEPAPVTIATRSVKRVMGAPVVSWRAASESTAPLSALRPAAWASLAAAASERSRAGQPGS